MFVQAPDAKYTALYYISGMLENLKRSFLFELRDSLTRYDNNVYTTDIVINNAGILRDRSFARTSDLDWGKYVQCLSICLPVVL